MTLPKMLKRLAAKETKIKQLDVDYRHIVAEFIMITSMWLNIL